MNFHIVHKNAQKGIAHAMDAIRAGGGVKLMTASSLRAHCTAISPANADPHFHAALCFLQSPHVSIALKRYRAESGNRNAELAERQFMQAINASRPAFHDDDEALYAKGLIHTPSGYHIAPVTLAHGSEYDDARRKIHPAATGILFRALDGAVGRRGAVKNIAVGNKTLRYIAVQLMPEGMGKQFKLNKLSQEVAQKAHVNYMMKSARAITLIAAELGIAFTKDMPAPELNRF